MTLILTESVRDGMQKHAETAYPAECCGLMLGKDLDNGDREVSVFVVCENAKGADEQGHRYHISPGDIMRASQIAEDTGLDVVGVYHSHPDAPAAYSHFDADHALPLWSYLIMACRRCEVTDLSSWRLSDGHYGTPTPLMLPEAIVVPPAAPLTLRDNVKAAAVGGIQGGGPSSGPPKPMSAPPPPDEFLAVQRVLNRQATDRALRRSKGTAAAMGRSPLGSVPGGGYPAYQAPGSRSTLGGM